MKRWLHRPSRSLAGAALRLLPDVLRMLRALVADPATPRRERWLLIGLFAWLASPIDLLPEFLPGIGPLPMVMVGRSPSTGEAGLFGRGKIPLRYDDDPGRSCLVRASPPTRPTTGGLRRGARLLVVGISEMKIPAGSHGIVYVRVSTAHQVEDELPVDSQIAKLTAAVERAGATCEVVKNADHPEAVKEMVEILNADIELRRSRESGDREQAARQVRSLERRDANLRRALRTDFCGSR
jgi:hypothetical protein